MTLFQGKTEYRSGYDALKSMCDNKTAQEIAHYLIAVDGMWSGRSLDTGAARIRACLSPEKAEYFKFSEIIAICAFTQRFDPIYYVCDRFGMSRPIPIDPQQQIAHLTGVIERATESLEYVTKMAKTITQSQEKYARQGQDQEREERSNVLKFCIGGNLEDF